MSRDQTLDDLIQRIREEARHPPYLSNETALAAPVQLTQQPSAAMHADLRRPLPQHLDALFAIGDDLHFIDDAYRSLLGRTVNPSGLSSCKALLERGLSRAYVYGVLRGSVEARNARRSLAGEGLVWWVFRLAAALQRFPLLGLAGRVLDRTYFAWRRTRAALSGRALQHIAILQGHTERLRFEAEQRAAGDQRRFDSLEHSSRAADEKLAQLDPLRHRLGAAETRQHQFEQHLGVTEESLTALLQRLEKERQRIDLLNARVTVLQRCAQPVTENDTSPASPQPVVANPKIAQRIDRYYVAFEAAHRGSEADVRAKLSVYLRHFGDMPAQALALPAVDVGCGRGEWLQLLRDNGFEACGIDLNPEMVEHCRSVGLNAHHADALEWLSRQPDASRSAVSAFHLVEHLPFELLFQLVEQAWRVLAPGGLLILETPNPENVLVGSHTFYHDFSHRNPVTPTALHFLVGYNGFDVIEMPRLSPYPEEAQIHGPELLTQRINGHFYGPQDYGLVARKPLALSAGTLSGAST